MTDLKTIIEQLDNDEKTVLNTLAKPREMRLEDLAKASKLNADSVRKVCARLKDKELVLITDDKRVLYEAEDEGKQVVKNGFIEKRLIQVLNQSPSKTLTIKAAGSRAKLNEQQTRIAVGWAKRNKWIEITKDELVLTEDGEKSTSKDTNQELLLKTIVSQPILERTVKEEYPERMGALKDLKKRNLIVQKEKTLHTITITEPGRQAVVQGLKIENTVNTLTPQLIKSGQWRTTKLRKYDVTAPVPPMYPGRLHPVTQATEYARRIWLELGFKEMQGPLIDTSFWVFDALFTPQDHPAREMQDTFFIEGRGNVDPKLNKRVASAHEGKMSGSKGWGYKYDMKVPETLVLRTHTTSLSVRTISELLKKDLPVKFFTVGRCFRNEKLDWKHHFEFNQTEGIVIDPNANYRHLQGYLKEFFQKLGYEKIRLKPGYFPYTSMDTKVEVYNEERNIWVELGGAGIFRPEVVEPLLGEFVPVLAWGLGMDRLYLPYYNFEKITELYKNDVNKLRSVPQWRL